jgi:hypothetical protein
MTRQRSAASQFRSRFCSSDCLRSSIALLSKVPGQCPWKLIVATTDGRCFKSPVAV